MYHKSYNSISDPAIVKEIGRGVAQMRLNKNISQQELADRSGINRTTISRFESGRAATLLTLVQILRAMDALDILHIFEHEQEVSPLQMLREQEKQKKYASHKRTKPKPENPNL